MDLLEFLMMSPLFQNDEDSYSIIYLFIYYDYCEWGYRRNNSPWVVEISTFESFVEGYK